MKLAQSLAHSSSRVEDRFWESRLFSIVDRLIAGSDDETLNAALDNLNKSDPQACDALAELIEFRCESRPEGASSERDVLLFAAPLLAWSRFAIPSGPIAASVMANLRVHLAAHIFATDVRFGLVDVLYSPDQLPQSFSETAQLTGKLIKATLHGRDLHIDPAKLAETASFLSDTRYLLGLAVVEKDAAIFRWQEIESDHSTALTSWKSQGAEAMRPLLPACASETLLPMAYHAACHEAERESRPYSIRASIAFLSTVVNLTAAQLATVIAPFQENHVEEFRVGFIEKSTGNVVHGVVWPLMDAEDLHDTPVRIEAVLRECGITDVRVIDHVFPLEYCDDCGVPLYPNGDDEAVHAELPENDSTQAPQHLH